MKYMSKSDNETVMLGKRLGSILKGGDAVALSGPLGSGKTWLTKGIGIGLGVDPDEVISSPSFSLVNEYQGRCLLYHIDLYRLDKLNDIALLGLDDYFHENSAVVVEWSERSPGLFPPGYISIRIEITGDNTRSIEINSDDPDTLERLEKGFI
ncbi:MAG: tRNA (adenosine(37)-N6)-threonylcarbamoyltransferase complex ATPase subunit type 1 TsaE [Deltaproteobacteria bacterium]|nr:tRNA (adenosine(37)-N6)-threonylcarbamoyltransferase complex ATPase subunit type 1 TsaE [Deltaproteobacteria bacterium]